VLVKIYLDPGHGGSDPGAVGNGLSEKNVTLAITKAIEESLKANYKNVDIMMSRDEDVFISLDERTNKANKWGADCFLSVHINASTSTTAKGFASYIYTSTNAKTKAFQNVLHTNIVAELSDFKIEDDGKKQANFHVLRESNMAALLTENFFISTQSEANLLKQADFIKSIARGHVKGLEKFFGLEKVSSPTPSTPTKLYSVICGVFGDRNNAIKRVEDLKAKGYQSYIDEK
jgi:N-acetylmuramoyl-L-alanine amidase